MKTRNIYITFAEPWIEIRDELKEKLYPEYTRPYFDRTVYEKGLEALQKQLDNKTEG